MKLSVHELMINFNNYIKSSWPYLRKIDIERDYGDDWDDWTELSFDIFVLSRIKEYYGVQIEGVYGRWHYLNTESNNPSYKFGNYVEVDVAAQTKLLVVHPIKRTIEELSLERSLSFSFVHFNNLCLKDDDSKILDYVEGEVIEDSSLLKLTQIIAPLKACTFRLKEDDRE